jgi:hypothetical protein
MHDIDRTLTEFELEADAFEDAALEVGDAGEMGVSSEEELDQFLGNLFKKAWRGLRTVGRAVGKVVRPLGSVLKPLMKRALPVVGGALGSFIPIPGVGTAVGSALGSTVSKALEAELELEGVSPEDKEFEAARRVVRVAAAAARQAALVRPEADPAAAAKAAVVAAARRHLPGLATPSAVGAPSIAVGSGRSGRWIRRGRKIVLLGV